MFISTGAQTDETSMYLLGNCIYSGLDSNTDGKRNDPGIDNSDICQAVDLQSGIDDTYEKGKLIRGRPSRDTIVPPRCFAAIAVVPKGWLVVWFEIKMSASFTNITQNEATHSDHRFHILRPLLIRLYASRRRHQLIDEISDRLRSNPFSNKLCSTKENIDIYIVGET